METLRHDIGVNLGRFHSYQEVATTVPIIEATTVLGCNITSAVTTSAGQEIVRTEGAVMSTHRGNVCELLVLKYIEGFPSGYF
jgi:hypothetical protein